MTQAESAKLPPGPAEQHHLDVDDETFALIRELTDEYGDIVRVSSPNLKHPMYLLSNPRDIKQVLVSNHKNYIKGVGFERVKMLLGNGIIVSDGAFWRRQRTMIQPAFSRGSIPRYYEMIKEVTLRLADEWEELADTGEAIDITTVMSEYALEVILRAIFSEDIEFFRNQDGINPFTFLTDDPSRNLMVAMKFRQLLKQVQVLIDQRRADGRRPFDFLSMMMDATASKTGESMSDRELVDEVATMIIAGHETSGGTLNWAWYLLAEDDGAEAEMAAESLSVCPDGDLQFEQIKDLVFTQQVVEESLRLYPPVWLYTRKALEDDVIGGYDIKAGDNIFLSPYLTQRLPAYWPDPDSFQPGRFAPEKEEERVPYAFFPFSGGPRRCIGEFFSLIEMKAHLAIMSRRFRLRFVPGPVELDPAINLRTRHSLYMTIEKKNPTE